MTKRESYRFAHPGYACYIITQDALRIRKRNGGTPRSIPREEFDTVFCKGINLFGLIRQIIEEHVKSYDPPKTIKARLHEKEPILAQKKRGRPATGQDPHVSLRLPAETISAIDAWAAQQSDEPTRSEALRRLIDMSLQAGSWSRRG